jgi:hypothetical protein
MPTLKFTADIERFAQKTKIATDTVVRKVVTEILSGVVDLTPVDTGRARSNWQVALGAPNASHAFLGDPKAREQSKIAGIKAGEPVFIFNNTSYIQALEYGEYSNPPKRGSYLKKGQAKGDFIGPGWFRLSMGGFSRQAPEGMARLTVARVVGNFSNIVNGAVSGATFNMSAGGAIQGAGFAIHTGDA